MVLKSVNCQNNNNIKCNIEHQEQEMVVELLKKIQHLLPEGYQTQNMSEFELVMMTIHYIESLQQLTTIKNRG